MKNNFDCEIIWDLLPLYLEHMTSEETGMVIREHLDGCDACRQQYLQMSSDFTDIFLEKKEGKKFLWFYKRKRKPHYKRKAIVKLLVYGYAFLMLAIMAYCIISMTFF